MSEITSDSFSLDDIFDAKQELKSTISSSSNDNEVQQKDIQWLSLYLLNPKYTKLISQHLQPSFLELVGYCKSLIGKIGHTSFNLDAHSALCVAFSKLLNFDNIRRYAQNYFKDAPSPFYHLARKINPPSYKRQKLDYQIPSVTNQEILEATYNLLLTLGPEISGNWNISDLLLHLKDDNEEIVWLASNCLALLVRMSEEEKTKLILQRVSPECHKKLLVSRHLRNRISEGQTKITVSNECQQWIHKSNEFIQGIETSKFTRKVGCVMLFHRGKVKNLENGLVSLPSTDSNLEAIALAVSSHQPVLIEGLVGSGKTTLVEHLGRITGRPKAPHLLKIQLSDQTDSKTLIGTYRCTANPGEFIWQAGSLTRAVIEGHWLLLEDIDFAPMDVISLLIPLLEFRILPVPGHGNVKASPNFQVFATRRLLPSGHRTRIGSADLLEKLWSKVPLQPLSETELKDLICTRWPELESIAGKLVEVYLVLSYGQHDVVTSMLKDCALCISSTLTATKTSGRFVSVRDMMKWCVRIISHLDELALNARAFQEAFDCFCAAVPDTEKRQSFAVHIGSHLNIPESTVTFYTTKYKPTINIKSHSLFVGSRAILPVEKTKHLSLIKQTKAKFSQTRLSSCLLEKVTVAVMNNEPVLIVGETGTGKTSTVQYLAQETNHPLKVINMNQQSDSSDLLGGFKPVDVRTVVSPLRTEFEKLFVNTFSAKQNTKFLTHLMTTFSSQRWSILFVLMKHTLEKAEARLNVELSELSEPLSDQQEKKMRMEDKNGDKRRNPKEVKQLLRKWENFSLMLKNIMDQVERAKSSLAFAFIEGSLAKAVQQGEWVLLDEINLATADTLECLTGLLESSYGSLTLHEKGDSEPVPRHKHFRLFACMNPATDVGKKELPVGLRNRFTEFFMDEFQSKDDLLQIVKDYLEELNPSPLRISGIVKFYLEVRELSESKLVDGSGHKPHFSLRTLCRALMVTAQNPCLDFPRSVYEAFCLSFLTQLDRSSYPKVLKLIDKYIVAKGKESLTPEEKVHLKKKLLNAPIKCPGKPDDYIKVESHWVPKGDITPEVPDKYILTKTVRQNLADLVRVVSIGRFPVLLQGDTSVGKTSLISYLAKLTGNSCVRVNNHQHTDLQEYVGSYAPDETGKLVFKEGVLVKAMRNGHWIILDELNLAPSDVLEALNRLLDDNRELFIPEIDTVVKAHERFMLFATQNPPGLYGGRQVLSRAFRNRFVELHFNIIPSQELETILEGRCQVPLSLSKKMVGVLTELQHRRRTSNIFEGKQSFVTLRDLFRWAERYRLAPKVTGWYDWDQHMVDEGYLVLAAKIRSEKDTKAVKTILKSFLKREVKEENLFDLSESTSSVTRPLLKKLSSVDGFEHVVWTRDMRRLFVLVSKSLHFKEPVLLVGDTGCGKTTVCQMIASLSRQKLFAVNCHMHTEGADFLGGLRPVRDRSKAEPDRLFEWVDGPLIRAMKKGGLFLADEISLADDSVLERLNSVLEPERTLVLSEKGVGDGEEAQHLEVIVAHKLFRLVGTMNPGGDYGKKELSPALRNRFTEIWCPKVEIERPSSDVEMIICHNLKISIDLSSDDRNVAKLMLFFLKCLAKTDLGKKLTISIRDIISWVSFINQVSLRSDNPLTLGKSYVHGACLVFLDSLGSGLTGNTILNWKVAHKNALQLLCWQAQRLSCESLDSSVFGDVQSPIFHDDPDVFGIEPFIIPKGKVQSLKPPTFSFRAPKTCLNLLRLLRALQVPRPILLEGSPGVGKTSLVVALAKASANNIVRINLSEQTDVSDLFGADLPIEGSEGGRFAWRDGPLLQALKEGSWIVLDELNLASQSVLEGLNACFDHRGEIFVPELNKTFLVKHESTKIFACQNPQYQGGARKGLPKSFLNRFTQVFIEPLSAADMDFILSTVHPDIPNDVTSKMIEFNAILVEEVITRKLWGLKGGPWELNLRDMFRWCEIMLQNQREGEFNPGEFVQLIYADRMRTKKDKDELVDIYKRVFNQEHFPLYEKAGTFFIRETFVQAGKAFLHRKVDGNEFIAQNAMNYYILQNQTPYLESLINCINMNWMAILVGDSSEGKTSLVHLLAQLTGQKLETVAVNSQMDVTELLGGFEQADYGRRLSELIEELEEVFWASVRSGLLNGDFAQPAQDLMLWKEMCHCKESKANLTTTEEVVQFKKACKATVRIIDELRKCITDEVHVQKLRKWRTNCRRLFNRVKQAGTVSGGGTFEWVDSVLVKAIRNGYWLLIDGVNLCSPSVLDRLNGVLEPGGVLTINERGVIKGSVPTISPHPNFRLFLTMDPQNGEISRAMRNRGVEICMERMWVSDLDIRSLLLSRGLENGHIQNLLIETHKEIANALPAHMKPSICFPSKVASLIPNFVEVGKSQAEALELSLNLVYYRNFGKMNYSRPLQNIIEVAVKKLARSSGTDSEKSTKLSLQKTDLNPEEKKLIESLNNMLLSIHNLNQSSSLGFISQLVSLLGAIQIYHQSKSVNCALMHLPRPLTSQDSLPFALFLCLISLPLEQWELFQELLVQSGPQNVKLLKCLKSLVGNPSVCFKRLNIICNGELPADPRFNLPYLKAKVRHTDAISITSLSNKALIGLWLKVEETFSPKSPLSSHKLKKKMKGPKSVLELSLNIAHGHFGEEFVYHPCLRQLSPLLQCIRKLMASLEYCEKVNLSDDEYFKLNEGLLWLKRTETICNKVASQDSFHLFLPQLVFHWTYLLEKLLDCIPSTWESLLPMDMPQLIEGMKHSFRDLASPLHHIIPDLRNVLQPPLPFLTQMSAAAYEKLHAVSENLIPHPQSDNEMEEKKMLFLGSPKGIHLKSCLLDLACNTSTESTTQLTKFIDQASEIETYVFNNLENAEIKAFSALHSVQLWPFMDYLISRQLSLTELRKTESAVASKDCLGMFVSASRIPIQLVRHSNLSKSEGAVALHLFNINNCCVLWPSRWMNFQTLDKQTEESDTELFWEGEETIVLSPMGCLLTYISLAGVFSPNEVGVLCVGNYSERVKHLCGIRKTLIHNWDLLVKPTYTYSACFTDAVTSFTSKILFSLLTVLDMEVPSNAVKDYTKMIGYIEEALVRHQELLQGECVTLLEKIIEVSLLISGGNTTIKKIAQLGILSGLLQSWLLSHTEPLDPVQERVLLRTYYQQELDDLESARLLRDWVKVLRYCQTAESFHPHEATYQNQTDILESEIDRLSRKIAYRPETSQYNDMTRDIFHFVNTVFHPSRILELEKVLTSKTNHSWSNIQRSEATLRSCDRFLQKMVHAYVLYKDLLTPFLHGVVMVCESLRVLMVTARHREFSLQIKKMDTSLRPTTLDETLSQLLYFPSLRGIDDPENFLAETRDCQKKINGLLGTLDSESTSTVHSKTLSYKGTIYDLYNMMVATNFISKRSFALFKDLIDQTLLWWQDEEELKKRKKAEEEALFKYKARSMAISETEAEEEDREYVKLFPDYSDEFDDLEDDKDYSKSSQDGTNPDPLSKSDAEDLKLSSDYLVEVIQVHSLVMYGLVDTPWLKSGNTPASKPATPISLRIQQARLLMKFMGPFATHTVDETSLAALIMSNFISSSQIDKTVNLSVLNKSSNYYHDPNLEATLKIRPLLEALEHRVDTLLETWPTHPSLLMIKKVIFRVLSFTVSSPMIRLVIGLEMVLEKSQEWERNSHKGVSLVEELTPIINQIIQWRKMELKDWRSCLDMVRQKISSQDAIKYWPHLYSSLISFTDLDVNDLVQPLKQFVESASVGCFSKRLELIETFHLHLALEFKYCTNLSRKKILGKLVSVTWNTWKYYSQFQSQVHEAITNTLKPIETQVKDFIKIMRWNDINFFSVQESVIKGRRTLQTYMRKWEKGLSQPVMPFLTDSISDMSESTGKWDSDQTPMLIVQPIDVEVDSIPGVDSQTLIGRLPALVKRSSTFITKTVNCMAYLENAEAVEDMTVDVITTYQDLVVADKKAQNLEEKKERLPHLKEIMNRKKNSFAILFKTLYHYGVSFTKGSSLCQEDSLDKFLNVPPLDLSVALKMVENCEDIKSCWKSCDTYYYKSIARFALLSKSLNQANKDLGPNDIKRLRGSTYLLLSFSLELRQILPEFTVATSEIDAIVKEVEKASQNFVPVSEEFSNWWGKIYTALVSLSLSLEEEIVLLEAFPAGQSLIELRPRLEQLGECDAISVKAELKKINSDLSIMIKHSLECNETLVGCVVPKLASFVNIEQLVGVVSEVGSFSTRLSSALRQLDENFEGTTSLTKSLIVWIDEWKKLSSAFTEWHTALSFPPEDTYNSSDTIENCTRKILKVVETLYKRYNTKTQHENEKNETTIEDETKYLISKSLVQSLISDYEALNIRQVKQSLFNLVAELKEGYISTLVLKSLKPLFIQYLGICKNILSSYVRTFRSLGKLESILLGIFQQLAVKGFCRPQELEEEEEAKGGKGDKNSGMGLCDGEGEEDVSERFESEDQLESALQEGQKEAEGDKDLAEDDGVELTADFEGKLQNRHEEEEERGKNESEGEEEDHDKQVGETEPGADKLDEKLWDDGDEEEEKKEDDKKEEHGPGDKKSKESEMVANEDNKNKKKKDDEGRPEREKLDVLEEDIRESEDPNEETYGDNYKDPLGGEDHENEEPEPLELNDDLEMEDEQGENSEDENGDDKEFDGTTLEIPQQPLFPEQEKEPKDKEEDNEDGVEGEDEMNPDPNENKEGEGEEGEEERPQRMVEEEEKGEEKEEGSDDEKVTGSKDMSAPEEVQAADMETLEASKDKTTSDPRTAEGAQPKLDEELEQEEQGEMGEEADDTNAVGQSDSRTNEDAHRGNTSALTDKDEARNKRDQQKNPRQPSDVNEMRSLGDVEKEIQHGLLTKDPTKEIKEKNDESSEDKGENNKDDGPRDADIYEYIGKADDHYDKQTIDAATEDQAKMRPAPLEDEEKKEEEAEVDDALMKDEPPEENTKLEETEKREAVDQGNDEPDSKRLKAEIDPTAEGEIQEQQMETEGDIVMDMVVQRPIANEIFTNLEQEEVAAAIFGEDVVQTRENVEEVGEGDAEMGEATWADVEAKVTPLSLQLCEQLRLVLEPTQASKLKGDFRSGKRLNMRKVIPYIASQFRKDKIWLRRTYPNKRAYQVVLAIDDSQSMSDSKSVTLAREGVALVAKALTLLEVGQVAMVSFGATTKLLHPFHKPFSERAGARAFANLTFAQSRTNFETMLEDSVALLAGVKNTQNLSHVQTSQLLLILSDGQTHARSEAVREAMQAAKQADVFVVFLVLDATDKKYSFYDAFVYDDKGLKSIVDTFPFPFFLVVRDLEGMPEIIAEALRQWFELVTSDSR